MTEITWSFDSNFERSLEGSAGSLSPDCIAKLIDDEGNEIDGYNKTGYFIVKDPTLTLIRGYYNDPEANAKAFDKDGLFHTRDLFQVDKEGNFTYIDRINDVIKYRYDKIIPQEIEVVLMSHPLVIDCVAIPYYSEKDSVWVPRAFVTLKKNDRDVAEVKEEILEIAKSQLSDIQQLRG